MKFIAAKEARYYYIFLHQYFGSIPFDEKGLKNGAISDKAMHGNRLF